jgi:hypothetical protein
MVFDRSRVWMRACVTPAWVHRSPYVEELALPKPVESGNLSVNTAVSEWFRRKLVEKTSCSEGGFNA